MDTFGDFNTSVEKALSEIDPNWKSYEGLIICGTHSPKDWEEQIEKIKRVREENIPFLGICAGIQLAVIEYARNKAGVKDATSQEFGTCSSAGCYVVQKLSELRVGLKKVRCQPFQETFNQYDSKSQTMESHWHNYYVPLRVMDEINQVDLTDRKNILKYESTDEIIEWISLEEYDIEKNGNITRLHPFFVAVQYHPEYQSSKEKPHPILVEFLNYAREYTKKVVSST